MIHPTWADGVDDVPDACLCQRACSRMRTSVMRWDTLTRGNLVAGVIKHSLVQANDRPATACIAQSARDAAVHVRERAFVGRVDHRLGVRF